MTARCWECNAIIENGIACEECKETASSDLSDLLKPATPELLKEVATEFFYWWHNQPGTNTQQGFDSWWEINHKRFGL